MTRLVNISEAVSLALHTMALLTVNSGQRLRNQEIADKLGASGHHLAKVMQRLAKAGLVDSVCGPQGGFLLDQPAEEVTLLRIYEAVEGKLDEQEGCLLKERICSGLCCMLGGMLNSVHRQLRDYFSETTLAEMAKRSPFVSQSDATQTETKPDNVTDQT